ncbi:Gp37 family protein [Thiothrix lacustris]|uniref:Gp37 family protein n=1 Tax=Thiothrix lacustris TaxID=525917 RepID=UPI0004905C2F|nr:Gp37 family protein [Thiothrix lacustris]
MSSPLLALEDAVISNLASASLGISVEPYPDRPADYSMIDPVGAALVVIPSSRYSPMINGVQTRTTRIVVTLLVRNLATHAGAYPLIDAVLATLQGWTPDDWQPVAAISEQFVTEDNGVWQYDLVFETSRLQITQYNPCQM